MSVVFSTDNSSGGKGALGNLQTVLNAAVAGSPRQKQLAEELVRSAMSVGRLPANLILSTFTSQISAAWLAKYHPEIANLKASITANPNAIGNITELNAAQIRAVDDAMAQNLISADSDVLATMS